MKKIVIAIALFLGVYELNAQENDQNVAIKDALRLFFKGLQSGDTLTMVKAIHKDLKLLSNVL